jgi:hypothetical protein
MMTDEIFEILRAAVTVSRNESIKKLDKLRARLAEAYPGKEPEIEAALTAWAAQERRTAMYA